MIVAVPSFGLINENNDWITEQDFHLVFQSVPSCCEADASPATNGEMRPPAADLQQFEPRTAPVPEALLGLSEGFLGNV